MMTDQEALQTVIHMAEKYTNLIAMDNQSYAAANMAIAMMQDIKLDTKPPDNPNIQDYQVEIRARVKGSHKLFGIEGAVIQNEYVVMARYDVIASSPQEATDMVREYENNGRREHELVRCTMRQA